MTNWEEKYQTGDTPWNKGEPSPGLVDFLAAHPDLKRGSVLVPGCGFGHDARVWAQAGFSAVGVDLAPSAVKLAADLHKDQPGLRFAAGNFLADEAAGIHDWLFEHTLYCAIDPSLRDAYVLSAARYLRPQGHLLSVHYLIPDTDGPPFGTDRDEVVGRFSPWFDPIEDWVPRSYPNRVGLERMFWWRLKTSKTA